VSGNLTAASFIKSGGTSAQILAADGSVITAGTNITISGGTISASGGGGGTTIYSGDGTLTGNRTVSFSTFNLRFTTPNTGIVFRELVGASSYFAIYGSSVTTPNVGNYSFITNALGTETQISGLNNSYLGAGTNPGINVTTNAIRLFSDVAWTGDNVRDLGYAQTIANRPRNVYVANSILVNTTTLAGFRLDVNGTARVSGDLTVTNSSTNAFINLNAGTSSSVSVLNLTSSGNVNNGQVASAAPSFTYGTIVGKETYLLGFGVVSLRTNDTGYIRFLTGNSDPGQSTEKARITNAGRFLLGTTSESTYIIDAVGDAKISNNVAIGSTVPSPIQSGSRFLFIGAGGVVSSATGSTELNLTSNIYYDGTNSRYRVTGAGVQQYFDSNGNILFITYPSASAGSVATGTERMRIKANGSVRYQPMATPASAESGDVYYDSSTNKLRCYNGTTWNDLF
jgi:hypothetical protein